MTAWVVPAGAVHRRGSSRILHGADYGRSGMRGPPSSDHRPAAAASCPQRFRSGTIRSLLVVLAIVALPQAASGAVGIGDKRLQVARLQGQLDGLDRAAGRPFPKTTAPSTGSSTLPPADRTPTDTRPRRSHAVAGPTRTAPGRDLQERRTECPRPDRRLSEPDRTRGDGRRPGTYRTKRRAHRQKGDTPARATGDPEGTA